MGELDDGGVAQHEGLVVGKEYHAVFGSHECGLCASVTWVDYSANGVASSHHIACMMLKADYARFGSNDGGKVAVVQNHRVVVGGERCIVRQSTHALLTSSLLG